MALPVKYRVIVADPPWETTAGPLCGPAGFEGAYRSASRPLAYPTMSLNRIAGLPVADLADDDCALFLWTINGYLPAAFDILKTWGFVYSTTLVWAKSPMGFGLGGAFGISTEFVLYARRGKPRPNHRSSGTWFHWKRAYDERRKTCHSAKPPQLQDLIETMFDGPRLEMFARSQRLGWDTWGNEAFNHVQMNSGSLTGEP